MHFRKIFHVGAGMESDSITAQEWSAIGMQPNFLALEFFIAHSLSQFNIIVHSYGFEKAYGDLWSHLGLGNIPGESAHKIAHITRFLKKSNDPDIASANSSIPNGIISRKVFPALKALCLLRILSRRHWCKSVRYHTAINECSLIKRVQSSQCLQVWNEGGIGNCNWRRLGELQE